VWKAVQPCCEGVNTGVWSLTFTLAVCILSVVWGQWYCKSITRPYQDRPL
jgi:hypothetical protein